MTGSVSRSKGDPSQSLQMTERPLMSADELKSMKKGDFIVMKTGTHPFISKLKLFFDWGIQFNTDPYEPEDKATRGVFYASREIIEEEIMRRYPRMCKMPAKKKRLNQTGGQALKQADELKLKTE